MRKNLLLLLLALVAGSVAANAYNVRWMVDNPANIKVYTQSGYGTELTVTDGGTTTVEDGDNPLLIEPAPGAEITELTVNMQAVNPSGDGKYRVGITANSMIQVTTSGGGAVNVSPYFFNMGLSGSAVITYGEGLTVQAGYPVEVPMDTEFTIAPAAAYKLTKVEVYGDGTATDNGNGTYTYTAKGNDYVYIYTEVAGKMVTVNVDYYPNVILCYGIINDLFPLTLSGGTNKVAVPDDAEFLQFYATEGAEIKSILRNGTALNPSSYVGWRSMVAENDVFEVNTQGPATEVTFTAAENNPSLEYYTFTVGDSKLDLSGTSATATLHIGDLVNIQPVGATKLTFVAGGQTIDVNNVRIAGDNTTLTVYGELATGVTINVSDADQIIVTQANGYGDVLQLQTGSNNFKLADLANSLQIKAVEGNRIESVTLDGTELKAGNNGAYLAEVTEGCYLDIRSKLIPANVPMTIIYSPDQPELYTGVELSIDGETQTLTGTGQMLSVAPGSVITISPKFGYIVTGVTAGNHTVTANGNTFTLIVEEPCNISIEGYKITAAEGEAEVSINAGENGHLMDFAEYSADGFVKRLSIENLNTVKIGNVVYIRCSPSNLYLKSVKINGKDVALEPDSRKLEITIEQNCEIEIVSAAKVMVATYSTNHPSTHDRIGNLYMKVGDKLLTNYEAEVGEVLTFVAEVCTGYELAYIARLTPASDEEYGMTYTVTQADLDNPTQLLVFEGVYTESQEKSYLLFCNQTLAQTVNGYEVVGFTKVLKDGVEYDQLRCLEGETVTLLAYARDDYHTVRFMLFNDPDVTLPQQYTVRGEDATSSGVIEIAAEFAPGSSSVGNVAAEGALNYDKAEQLLSATAAIKVYNAAGALVLATDECQLSVSSLKQGIYVAVSADKVLKFVK